MRWAGLRRGVTGFAVVSLSLALAAPALAHDHRGQEALQARPNVGPAVPASPDAVAARASLAPHASGPSATTASLQISGTVTNVPTDPLVTYQTPADPCARPSCLEYQVSVAAGSGALYARVAWTQPAYYVHIWGIAPDGTVVGQQDVSQQFDKTIGNERTIPVSEFTVAKPRSGEWRVQVRAVFGYEIAVSGRIAVTADQPLEYKRQSVLDLADKFGKQNLRVNVVFLGRTPSGEQLKAVRSRMPDEYRSSVLLKEFIDCPIDDPQQLFECQAGGLINWEQGYYRGTDTTADDDADGAGGNVPFFEPLKFTYDYRFFEANERYTRDLFGHIKSITEEDKPFDDTDVRDFLVQYNAQAAGGQLRNLDGAGVLPHNARVSDKIDAISVEDWVFEHRRDRKYADAFRDLESGKTRDGFFINPDPGAYYDPFYTGGGKRDLTRMPQGPRTSVTMYVIDSYTTPLARDYFRADRYHSYDVSKHMIDPDVGLEKGPDYMRLWGGNYPFFFLDLGAMPNKWETVDGFTGTQGDSTTFPLGDPPVWEQLHNPTWGAPYAEYVEQHEERPAADVEQYALWDKIARNIRMAIFLRFTAPYLYRPLPADVFFLAANIWSDYYSRPTTPFSDGGGLGLSHTVLEKIYRPAYVEKNLESALPGATFTTERSDPSLHTYRYLGCSDEIAGSTSQLLGEGGLPGVMVPNPSCTDPDPTQRALERAKAQGEDLVGAGVPAGSVSATYMRTYIEQHRNKYAPLRPGQLTITNISVVWPDVRTWYLPAIVGGVAFGTPNDEIWGILQNVNERAKPASATDCSKSPPTAPGCNGTPEVNATADGFSYTIQHEASHFLGLLHPHDTLVVERDAEGKWRRYGQVYVSLFDFSQAPTTYAGNFFPYSVLDQDIIQRGHWAEYLRQAQDTVADAYLVDGMNGLDGPSKLTLRKRVEMERWRALGAQLFACGDYLHAEHAGRNALLAAGGTFGPVVEPRPLRPGEKVLFKVQPQPVFGPDGRIRGCSGAAALSRPPPGAGPQRPPTSAGNTSKLPATGRSLGPIALVGLAALTLAACARLRSRLTSG